MNSAIRRMRKRIGRGLTFEKVWATMDRNAEEARERQKEYEERQKKYEEQREQKKKEYEEQQKKRQKEIDRQIKNLNEQMGGLHRSFGEMAEHLVAPGIIDKFNEMGFHIMKAATHGMKILDENKKVRTEVDLYMENGDYIFAIEVKARLGKKDIDEHRKQLEILRENANRTGDRRKILGGMAVAILEKGEKEAILDAGFYLLVQSGDTMKIDLPEGFVPREW